VRVGVVLPVFSSDAARVLEAARRAEEAGLHGLFVFDHLWPMGQPQRPALSALPTLAAVAASTRRPAVGTLVARIGLLDDQVLVDSFSCLAAVAGDRLVAGVGLGDRRSAEENRAFGVAYEPPEARRRSLARVVGRLVDASVATWVGGGSAPTRALARRLGAALNLWGAPAEEVAAEARAGEVTWGDNFPPDPARCRPALEQVARAGASWGVLSWPRPAGGLEALAEAAARLA
jgi:alkanesulfonate monooxygenase SsuD/methylene tetrahydromethanopterin reductase-like flavin-dependent oxidoreductase (luciferase family)